MVFKRRRKRRRIVIDLTEEDSREDGVQVDVSVKGDQVDEVDEFDPDDDAFFDTSQARSQGPSVLVKSDGTLLTDLDSRSWVDKYSSVSSQKICAVSSRKKVEISEWLRHALDGSGPKLLVLAGPPGCGKSSAVQMVAKEVKCAISSWNAPVPGSKYIAATLLDDFQSFFVSSRYPSLTCADDEELGNDIAISNRRLLLVDDVPVHLTDSQMKRDLLRSTLSDAAKFAPHPTVVVVSDSDKGIARFIRQVLGLEFLESSHVTTIKVPAITDFAMKKRLQEVLGEEGLDLGKDQLQMVAASSNGDIRSALNSLQFAACTNHAMRTKLQRNLHSRSSPGKRRRTRNPANVRIHPVTQVGLDATLGTYHAISKILNNKREENGESKYVAETVLEEARADPSSFLAFLHHNYPDFFGDVEDAVSALSCLSEADCFLPWRQDEAARLGLSECAASVATRGFLYYNRNPQRKGWRPIRGPESFEVAKEGREYVEQVRQDFSGMLGPCIYTRSTICESVPFAELISKSRRMRKKIPSDYQGCAAGAAIADAADIAMVDVEDQGSIPFEREVQASRTFAMAETESGGGMDEDIEEWDDDG